MKTKWLVFAANSSNNLWTLVIETDVPEEAFREYEQEKDAFNAHKMDVEQQAPRLVKQVCPGE